MFIPLIKLLSHSFVSFKVYCMLCNSHCFNITFQKVHVHTEISVWSWTFGLKSWKSSGIPLVNMCTNPVFNITFPIHLTFSGQRNDLFDICIPLGNQRLYITQSNSSRSL